MFVINGFRQITLLLLLSSVMLLTACSSPLKYEPRSNQSGSYSQGTTQEKTKSVPSCKSNYVVKSGDTLSAIAHKCDVSMRSLARLNNLLPPYLIYVKQELRLSDSFEATTRQIEIANKAQQQTKPKPETVVKELPKSKVVMQNSSQSAKDVSAKAIERTVQPVKKVTKSKAWVWPMHKGLDYRFRRDNAGLSVLEVYGVPGQKVKAVTSGKVVYAGNGIVNYGWMLVIKHTNDYMSIYAHNSALLVKEGDVIEAGQVVATMGATGNTKRPKLYLEARYQGRKIDIKKVLKH